MKDKEVFDVHKLNIDAYARSLGLAITPRIRFLQRLKARIQSDVGVNKKFSSTLTAMTKLKKIMIF